jgi:cytochrome b pre-mRNA-processing protein 3
MSLLSALKRALGAAPPHPADLLYAAVVAEARLPHWYLDGQVPDTLDGRFDMVALLLSLLLLRLEAEQPGPDHPAARLNADVTDRFITDMDGNLRQDGVSDTAVGKHLGKMMAALGGRLGAYRAAGADDSALAEALVRNLWRGVAPDAPALAHVVAGCRQVQARLAGKALARLEQGEWPA